jgi:predicted nucleotidyltransferase
MDARGNDPALVDRVLGGISALIELCFPTAIKSAYLCGSQAGGEVHPSSDIDLLIVLNSAATPDTVERLEETLRACSAFSLIPIDATVVDESDMADFGAALLSDEVFLVMGTHIRESLSYPSSDLVAATLMHMAFAAVASHYPSGGTLPKPLAPADAEDPWLGFGQNSLPANETHPIPDVKRLVTLVIRITQALLAVRTGRMIHPKGELLAVAFRNHLEGPWADYVATFFRRYRDEWWQRISGDDEGRQALRQLCENAYRFAEWFLGVYREFLVADLRHPDDKRRRLARRNIVRLPFPTELV